MPTKISNFENRIYIAIWRKAVRGGEPFTITLRSTSEALALRMGLYRAIRPYRVEAKIDIELQTAAETWTPVVKKGSCDLVMLPRKGNEIAEIAMKTLGLTEDDLLSPEELEAQESARKVVEGLQGPRDFEQAKNVFYERESE